MTYEKPDMLRQSGGFEEVHSSLRVALIATSRGDGKGRSDIRVCRPNDSLAQVTTTNVDPVFDYLPVERNNGDIVGLFSARNSSTAKEGHDDELVRDHMCPLSEADLIGANTPILDFIRRVRPKPLLVVSGERIDGLVAWSDLQKLPVRAAVFALVTGFELTMYEAIKVVCTDDDDWNRHLASNRLEGARRVYERRDGSDSDVDLLLCTEFCDKRTILKKCLPFTSTAEQDRAMPISKRTFATKVKNIEDLRDPLAHASTYAMNWDDVESLKETVQDVVTLREQIKHVCQMSA